MSREFLRQLSAGLSIELAGYALGIGLCLAIRWVYRRRSNNP